MAFAGLLLLAGVGGVLYLNHDRLINYVAQMLYNTGPLPATITGMRLSMYSTSSPDSKPFAQIRLPPIHASPSGTVCKVVEQEVGILDFAAFHTFNRNLLLQEELPAYIRGAGMLTLPWPVDFLTTEVKYEKVEVLKGLDGVHVSVLETRKASRSLLKGKPTAIEVDVNIKSDSQVAIDMGAVQVEITFSGVRIATVQSDSMFLKQGDNQLMFTGSMDFGSIGKNLGTGLKFLKKDVWDDGVEAYVKGVEGRQCTWLDQTVKLMNSRIEMGSTMSDILRSVYAAEESAG